MNCQRNKGVMLYYVNNVLDFLLETKLSIIRPGHSRLLEFEKKIILVV